MSADGDYWMELKQLLGWWFSLCELIQLFQAHPARPGSYRLVQTRLVSSSSFGQVWLLWTRPGLSSSSGLVQLVLACSDSSGLVQPVRACPGSYWLVQTHLVHPGSSRLVRALAGPQASSATPQCTESPRHALFRKIAKFEFDSAKSNF